jgi:hypothetical protein
VHFTFTFGHEKVELYLYSPYGPYGLYRASVPVQGCTLPLPLVMKEYSYTSTPPMGRTACTEPQCLYKGALYMACLASHLFVNDIHILTHYFYNALLRLCRSQWPRGLRRESFFLRYDPKY